MRPLDETASASLAAAGDLMAILPGSLHPTSRPRARYARSNRGNDDVCRSFWWASRLRSPPNCIGQQHNAGDSPITARSPWTDPAL